MAAWEDERAAWLPHTKALMLEAVEGGVPLLGICLGAQMLALAAGGRVEPGAAGIEAGLSTIRPTEAAVGDRLMDALPLHGYPGPQGHHDSIVELPPGAVLLATGDIYRHQAFRLGEAAWAVQYHPEVTADDFEGWMREDAEVVAAVGKNAEDVVREVRAAEAELDGLARAHAEAFLRVVEGARRDDAVRAAG
jgi:GMP synthase-like glutamine amidotransferase